MPFSRVDRKTVLLQGGKSQRDIAQATGTDETLVSHVLAGRRWSYVGAQSIMRYVAELAGVPVQECFPGSERRTREDRRQSA